MYIDRPAWKRRVHEAFSVHPVVAVTGPRQCGKTTLARAIAADSTPAAWFDLEAAVDRRRLRTPELTLGPLRGLVVIDEVQRSPELYETIRVLVDRTDNRARFLLLGSASPTLALGTRRRAATPPAAPRPASTASPMARGISTRIGCGRPTTCSKKPMGGVDLLRRAGDRPPTFLRNPPFPW